jgi:CubicO group peptidase (beta-lactamase class C family)
MRSKIVIWSSFFAASILLSIPVLAKDVPCGSEPLRTDDWETARPEEVGLDAAVLCTIATKLHAPDRPNLHAVIVIRHGKLVYETYAAGKDERWGADLGIVKFDATMQHDTRSISKSVVSLLFGIAVDRNLLAGTDIPVLSFFPEYPDLRTREKDRILLRHLLTMTAGFTWNEKTPWSDPLNTERRMYRSLDPYRYVLERDLAYEPDERWEYNSGTTTLLGAVLKKVTGKSLSDFSKQALFEPLHIQNFEWVLMLNGDAASAAGLRLRPRDMAKIGQLVLNRGEWRGRRIVSKDWLSRSTEARFKTWGPMRYGYHWWAGTSTIGATSFDWTAAMGLGGQRIFIVRSVDLVVVTTGGLYADGDGGSYVHSILESSVLPAIRD